MNAMSDKSGNGNRSAGLTGHSLAIDLFCGLGGWTDGLLAEGWDVVGFDIERHEYGEHRYPAQLVIQDVLTLHGSQFRRADLIVASPPCTEYSYMAMPWTRAKRIGAALKGDGDFPEGYRGSRTVADLNCLFDACFRIQREACEAAGRHIPLIVENVKGAQPWVGRARWNFGSFYLWGDVPALMPPVSSRKFNPDRVNHPSKNNGGSWFSVAHNKASGSGNNPDGRKTSAHPNRCDGHDHTRHLTNPAEHGVKHHATGAVWFDTGPAALPSGSSRRKAASAMIAKIPEPLSRWIAVSFKPIPIADGEVEA